MEITKKIMATLIYVCIQINIDIVFMIRVRVWWCSYPAGAARAGLSDRIIMFVDEKNI